MVTKLQTLAQKWKLSKASRESEQQKTDRDRANDVQSKSRSLNKQSLNSSAVPNTSTVLKTTLKSIGPFIIKILDFGQYVVKRSDGIKAPSKCLGKIIAIECNLDQAIWLHDIMDCAEE
jgi:hypothetical protein